MSNYVLAASRPEHRAWLERRLGRRLDPDGFRGVEAQDSSRGPCGLCGATHGRIVAMAGFESWTATGVGVHVAADRPVALRHWRETLRYAFEQCGKTCAWAMVASSCPSLRLALRVGFREAGRVPDGYAAGDDLVLLFLRRSE